MTPPQPVPHTTRVRVTARLRTTDRPASTGRPGTATPRAVTSSRRVTRKRWCTRNRVLLIVVPTLSLAAIATAGFLLGYHDVGVQAVVKVLMVAGVLAAIVFGVSAATSSRHHCPGCAIH
jgi:hypothetical protein